MPSGDAHRQWFPEMIEVLQRQWSPELSWPEFALLTARLNSVLQQIRSDRNIIPPMFTCPKCGKRERSMFTGISINATILAAGRFGIAPQNEVKELSNRWKRYRKQNGLDNYGKKACITTVS